MRVVVADDDVLLREGLASLLTRSGYQVVGQVGEATSLLDLVRDEKPDLAIVDIRMPPTGTTDGLDAALIIRDEMPTIGLLILSAHVAVEHAMQLLASGRGIGYLLKTRVTDVTDFLDTLGRIAEGACVVDPALVAELVSRAQAQRSARRAQRTGEGSACPDGRGSLECWHRPSVVGVVGSGPTEPLPPGAEQRVSEFTELVATAIANAEAHAALTASRARIVTAADDARRRLERDLHDGAQQRLVSLAVQLRSIEAGVPSELGSLKEQISDAVAGLNAASADLQELARGIHPAIESKGGLGPALKMLARRCTIPVTLHLELEGPIPESAEVAAYYVVAEALTNAMRHAQASGIDVDVLMNGSDLVLSIRDDGIGGADSSNGSGLIGLIDRVEALGGQMQIASPPGDGTVLHVAIPTSA